MGIKDEVKKQGLRLMSDPRVVKLVQSEQVTKAVLALAQMPDRVSSFTTEQADRLAKTLRLATEERIERLEQRVAQLEAELDAIRGQTGHNGR